MLSHLAASAQGVEVEIKAHLPILLSSLRPCRLPEGTEPRRCKTASLRHLEAILHQYNSSKDTSTKGEGMVGDGEGAEPGKNQLFYDPFSHRKQKQKETVKNTCKIASNPSKAPHSSQAALQEQPSSLPKHS